jgi:hypothetical protein
MPTKPAESVTEADDFQDRRRQRGDACPGCRTLYLTDNAQRLLEALLPMIDSIQGRLCGVACAVSIACGALLHATTMAAATVPVRYAEGLVHGFLVLRTLEGNALAEGDLIQVVRGTRVSCRLVFRFKDGSVHDEIAVFSQRGEFRLLTYHLAQKGPAFPHPIDVSIDGSSGQVRVQTTEDGKEKVVTERLALPVDLANGMVLTLLKNIRSDEPETKVSMVAATPKPRLVKLKIASQGEDSFLIGGSARKAIHYVVKVEIGGVAGLVAPILGKQPADTHVWILGGDAPAFVKSEGPLYNEGPSLRIELTSPVWPSLSTEDSNKSAKPEGK